jgi:prevent-host-death family protein
MAPMPLSKAREELGTLVNRVSIGRERVVISRNGKGIAAVVSMEDLELIRRLEDAADLKAALAARAGVKKHGTVPWDDVKGAGAKKARKR